MSKTFGQYGTSNYIFFTYSKDGFIFLVMTDPSVDFYIFSMRLGLQLTSSNKFSSIFFKIMMRERDILQLLIN